MITIGTALAYSIAGIGDAALTSGLNDVLWVLNVIASFPAAILIMVGSFGLWPARPRSRVSAASPRVRR
jgi:hypothetical protein